MLRQMGTCSSAALADGAARRWGQKLFVVNASSVIPLPGAARSKAA